MCTDIVHIKYVLYLYSYVLDIYLLIYIESMPDIY